jgi:hypothetical protein
VLSRESVIGTRLILVLVASPGASLVRRVGALCQDAPLLESRQMN